MNFDEKAKGWDLDPKRVERAQLFAAEIVSSLGGTKNLTALEFGSGTGLVSFQLTDTFSSITLADSSAGMMDVLNQKIRSENISIMHRFLIGGSNTLRKLSDFDVVYTLLTLHHIKDIPETFSEFRDVLKPGGKLYIGDLITEDGSFHFRDPEFDGHLGFDPDELIKLLSGNGFGDCRSKIFHTIEREDNLITRRYPLFFLSATKL
jgi:ubiquinone/menaquinone biosynthesis C-methylase UbiE